MTKATKELKQLHDEITLHDWCLEQASERFCERLSQERIDRLNAIGFPWAYYEEQLDNLGYHWKRNNPQGVRFSQITQD